MSIGIWVQLCYFGHLRKEEKCNIQLGNALNCEGYSINLEFSILKKNLELLLCLGLGFDAVFLLAWQSLFHGDDLKESGIQEVVK